MNYHMTTQSAYHAALRHLIHYPDHVGTADGTPTRELLDCSFRVLEPTSEPLSEAIGETSANYEHLIWHKRSVGRNSASKMPHALTPWEWCQASLKQDQDTREAVLDLCLPSQRFFGTVAAPPLLHGVFRILHGALNLTIVSARDDVVWTLPHDLPYFASVLDRVTEDLRSHYPGIARGSLAWISHCLYLADADLAAAEKLLGDA